MMACFMLFFIYKGRTYWTFYKTITFNSALKNQALLKEQQNSRFWKGGGKSK